MGTCTYGASVKEGVNPDAEIMMDKSTWYAMIGATTSWFDYWLASITPIVVKVSDL